MGERQGDENDVEASLPHNTKPICPLRIKNTGVSDIIVEELVSDVIVEGVVTS